MTTRFPLAFVALVLMCWGCNYEPSATQDDTYIDETAQLAGVWRGVNWLTIAGEGSTNQEMHLGVRWDGRVLTVSNFCPRGGGMLKASANGRTATWTGEVSCDVATLECPNAKLLLTSATLELNSEGTLVFDAEGWRVGCTDQRAVSGYFIGRR